MMYMQHKHYTLHAYTCQGLARQGVPHQETWHRAKAVEGSSARALDGWNARLPDEATLLSLSHKVTEVACPHSVTAVPAWLAWQDRFMPVHNTHGSE